MQRIFDGLLSAAQAAQKLKPMVLNATNRLSAAQAAQKFTVVGLMGG